jgi:hypothetical protein
MDIAMRKTLAIAAAVLSVTLLADQAGAQSSRSGSSGSSRSGSSSASRTGSSMFSGNSASSMSGGAGRRSGGQTDLQNSLGNNGEFQLGSGGQTTGSERFMRGNRQQGNFVGSDISEVTQLFSNLTAGRAGTDGAGNFGPQQRGRQGDFDNLQQGNNTSSQIVPHRLVVSFPYRQPRISLPTANSAGEITIRGLARVQSRGPVRVELQDRTAVLRGVVATNHDRALAEQLALLEPGISRVENQLTVAESLPTTSAVPETP